MEGKTGEWALSGFFVLLLVRLVQPLAYVICVKAELPST